MSLPQNLPGDKFETLCRLPRSEMRFIPGSTFRMGSDNHYPEEAPAHTVTVEPFWIDEYAVTNEMFALPVQHAIASQAPDPFCGCFT